MENTIIPFGKYKGQPIEVMLQDQQYVQWIQQNGWLAQNHPQINTVIINNFMAPSETPEHNKIQGLFLDDDYILKFVNSYCESIRDKDNKRREYILRILSSLKTISVPQFEYHAIDVQFYLSSKSDGQYADSIQFVIEIKPIIGDDYPAVLRQIRSLKIHPELYTVLLIKEYNGIGITEENFIKLFYTQNIVVMFIRDII